eukprot:2562877-Amphidinium_carterae.1
MAAKGAALEIDGLRLEYCPPTLMVGLPQQYTLSDLPLKSFDESLPYVTHVVIINRDVGDAPDMDALVNAVLHDQKVPGPFCYLVNVPAHDSTNVFTTDVDGKTCAVSHFSFSVRAKASNIKTLCAATEMHVLDLNQIHSVQKARALFAH